MARLDSQANPLPFFRFGRFHGSEFKAETEYDELFVLGLFGRYTISTWAVVLGTSRRVRTAAEETGDDTGSDILAG